MPSFSYRALKADGKFAEGVLDAGGRADALRQIETLGLRPVNVTESAARAAKAAKNNGTSAPSAGFSFKLESKKVSAKELENFTRLLSSLLAAGVPLSRALVILQKEASSAASRQKWKEIHDSVVDGLSLSDAMAKSPDTFPRVYVAMVEAGEAGGFLDVVLAQIAEFQAREKDLKSKVLTAMMYPVILLVLGIGILIMLLTFFIPKFQGIFSSMHANLPLITQIIIGASNAVRSYGLIVAGVLIGLIFVLRAWFVSAKGRRTWEGLVLKSPLVGPLVAQFAMARFCRMLGTLLGAGVALVQGLNVARRSIGNQILVDAVGQSIERVQQGGRLGQSLGDCRILFSGSVIEMISVAEESGRLDAELVRLAAGTENDLDRNLKTAVAFAEPLLLFLIAGFIGTIFIGMLLPVLTMSQYIK
ncbi:MAG TPA: type II secretion system F family protein [Candidatus Sulfotelmatobacter sp.]|jgi:type II secretory pathway component PulF|nr:type II secretion system F family protein [Candidatus Sulfotelmatobacter sp.]